MSDATNKIDSFVRTYLKKSLAKLINKDPKLKTNPRMQEWFTLGFYAGAAAQGDAMIAVFDMSNPVEVDPVPEEEEVNDDDNRTS